MLLRNFSIRFANLAPWDRALRMVCGALLLAIGWWAELNQLAAVALRIFGWVPVLTGLLGWSPLYSLLDITTRTEPDPEA